MTAENISECMNGLGTIMGIVCGLLLVLILAIVWGYHRNA